MIMSFTIDRRFVLSLRENSKIKCLNSGLSINYDKRKHNWEFLKNLKSQAKKNACIKCT